MPREEGKVIKIIYLNARSLVNKLNDLEILLNEQKPDLVLICETWCNDETTLAMLNIGGYYIDPSLREDRSDTFNGIGGGLLIYVRNTTKLTRHKHCRVVQIIQQV